MEESRPGGVLSAFAALFALLAVSNLLKPLHFGGAQTGFVFFGTRLSGLPNAIVGPLFGIFLLAYAAGIWRMRRYALPMAWAYAAYVIVNLVMFGAKNVQPPGEMLFGIGYIAVAVGVSSGAAILLTRRKAQLG